MNTPQITAAAKAMQQLHARHITVTFEQLAEAALTAANGVTAREYERLVDAVTSRLDAFRDELTP